MIVKQKIMLHLPIAVQPREQEQHHRKFQSTTGPNTRSIGDPDWRPRYLPTI